MKNPLISLVVPVYNWETYIKKCLDSILSQTYKNFEIIVINDWSKDNTLGILWGYKDPRIKVFSQENKGLWLTRNVWINHAKWEYILFVDSDDFIEKSCLKNYVDEINKWDYDIYIWWYKIYDWEKYENVEIKGDLFSIYNHTEPRNRIYKKEFLDKNDIKFKSVRSHEDMVIWLEAYSKTDKIKIIKSSWYVYFVKNMESITRTMHKHFFEDYWKVVKYCCETNSKHKKNNVYAEYKILKASIIYILFAWRNESPKSFMEEYNKLFWLMKKYFNIYILRFVFKENVKTNIAILWFLFFDKLHLMKLLSKIYCRG